jgi:hypothetical protein
VYCIFAKSANSNFQFTLLFESRIGNFPKTLLLVSRAKIQYARDGDSKGGGAWILFKITKLTLRSKDKYIINEIISG